MSSSGIPNESVNDYIHRKSPGEIWTFTAGILNRQSAMPTHILTATTFCCRCAFFRQVSTCVKALCLVFISMPTERKYLFPIKDFVISIGLFYILFTSLLHNNFFLLINFFRETICTCMTYTQVFRRENG